MSTSASARQYSANVPPTSTVAPDWDMRKGALNKRERIIGLTAIYESRNAFTDFAQATWNIRSNFLHNPGEVMADRNVGCEVVIDLHP